MKLNKITLAALFFVALGTKAGAVTLKEALANAGHDVVVKSKVTFLQQAEIGWGWNLREDSNGSPMALLGVYQYRFINLNLGWHDPFTADRDGIPSILAGIHLDGLARTIAPGASEFVKNIVPSAVRPVWEILTVSYGPGYDLDRGHWTHFVAVNFLFGGSGAE